MEFPFSVSTLCAGEEISIWDRERLLKVPKKYFACIETVINSMGEGSVKAQGLKAVLTSTDILMAHPDQHLYLIAQDNKALGILKTGPKHLFIRNALGDMKEITPLCVLDFYVNESCQRSGIGHKMFMFMLSHEEMSPALLGYDRPSKMFLGFLRKYYGLVDYIPQPNNFVVFKRYFDLNSARPTKRKCGSASTEPPSPFAIRWTPVGMPVLPEEILRSERVATLDLTKPLSPGDSEFGTGSSVLFSDFYPPVEKGGFYPRKKEAVPVKCTYSPKKAAKT